MELKMTEKERDKLLAEIVERELGMFLAAPSQGGPSQHQERPDAFRIMRLMTHSAHGEKFLRSYLGDLRQAQKKGRNFTVEKYGLLDELIDSLSDNPLIDEIADAETSFLTEAAQLHPGIIKAAGSEMYKNFLRCELRTLSPQSLELYAEEMREAKRAGANPALERHNWLARKLGKPTLSD